MARKQQQDHAASHEAVQLLCQSNFHRCLFLPESSTHSRLRVTYAVSSNFSDESLPTILFCGPLFASRYHAVTTDLNVTAAKVRVIHVDRPGFGGSTHVSLSQRIPVWLELVPVLLKTLGLKHVHLLTHSAGTLYLLNTLWHYPEILDPKTPYVAVIAPWVHSKHSRQTLLSLASKLPSGVVNGWDSTMRFVINNIAPAANWSGGAISAFSGIFNKTPPLSDLPEPTSDGAEDPRPELTKAVQNAQLKFMLSEDSSGINDEARLCLKMDGVGWDACEDYVNYIIKLKQREATLAKSQQEYNKLKVRIYFAESDLLIGKGGQKYFLECWGQEGGGEHIDFESCELKGTNHETAVLDPKRGALRLVLEEVSQLHAGVES